jgi:hypothetical protein
MTWLEALTPFWPGIITLVGFFVVGGFSVWNRGRGATENKAPSVADIWAREERVSARARRLEAFINRIRSAFWSYVARVQSGGSTELTPTERSLLEEDPTEKEDT